MSPSEHAEHRADLFDRSTTTALIRAARVLVERPPSTQATLDVAAILQEVERRHPQAALSLDTWLNDDANLADHTQAAYLERLAAALPANVA